MMNITDKFTNHVSKYLYCYLFAYILVMPLSIKLLTLIYYGHNEMYHYIYAYNIGNIIVLVSAVLKTKFSKNKFIYNSLYLCGIILILYCTYIMANQVLGFSNIWITQILALIITCIISLLFVLIYAIHIRDNLLNGKEFILHILVYYVVLGVILYIVAIAMGRYYSDRINNIISKGSYFVSGGLTSKQIDYLINIELDQSIKLLSILIFVFIIVFFIIFSNIVNKFNTHNQHR